MDRHECQQYWTGMKSRDCDHIVLPSGTYKITFELSAVPSFSLNDPEISTDVHNIPITENYTHFERFS